MEGARSNVTRAVYFVQYNTCSTSTTIVQVQLQRQRQLQEGNRLPHLSGKGIDRPVGKDRYAMHRLGPYGIIVEHHKHSPQGSDISTDFVPQVMWIHWR